MDPILIFHEFHLHEEPIPNSNYEVLFENYSPGKRKMNQHMVQVVDTLAANRTVNQRLSGCNPVHTNDLLNIGHEYRSSIFFHNCS